MVRVRTKEFITSRKSNFSSCCFKNVDKTLLIYSIKYFKETILFKRNRSVDYPWKSSYLLKIIQIKIYTLEPVSPKVVKEITVEKKPRFFLHKLIDQNRQVIFFNHDFLENQYWWWNWPLVYNIVYIKMLRFF